MKESTYWFHRFDSYFHRHTHILDDSNNLIFPVRDFSPQNDLNLNDSRNELPAFLLMDQNY